MSELKSSEGEEAWAWKGGFQEGEFCFRSLTYPPRVTGTSAGGGGGAHTHLQNNVATSDELQSQDNDVNDHVLH